MTLAAGAAALAGAARRPASALAATPDGAARLRLRPAEIPLAGPGRPKTDMWTYGGAVPGPVLRLRQGQPFRAMVENGLDEERLANLSVARTMGLRFEGHRPVAVAYDGQPCGPHVPADGRVVLGAAIAPTSCSTCRESLAAVTP